MEKLLKDIEDNYLKLDKDITKILNTEIEYKLKIDPDNKDIIMIFNNLTNELLATAKFNYIGIYDKKTKMWYWAWSLVKDKSLIEKSLVVKEGLKGTDLNELVKYDKMEIEDENIISLVKMSLFYMNDIWYFVQELNQNILQFISIEEILENYI